MDSYQAVYDAVRSKISGGDIGQAVRDVAWQHLDISHMKELAQQEIIIVSQALARPSVIYKPTLSADGTMWCALLGDNLQVGVAGFGDTPSAAMDAFDQAFWNEKTPAAKRAALSPATGGE